MNYFYINRSARRAFFYPQAIVDIESYFETNNKIKVFYKIHRSLEPI